MTEVLAPTMIDYASGDLAATMVPRLLRGDETWCQGFSEPGTGSNLAALQCRATLGQTTAGGSTARRSGRASPITPTVASCSPAPATRTRRTAASQRSSSTWTSPGITVRPLETMNGIPEFSEVFFDDVAVPFERTLGEVDQGWSSPWDCCRTSAAPRCGTAARSCTSGLVTLLASVARRRQLTADISRRDVRRSCTPFGRARGRPSTGWPRGETLGAETSVDKVMLATAEQSVFDLAAEGLAESVLLGDDTSSQQWRAEYLYSRAATIYGGTAEVQRNVIARRLLDLGTGSLMDDGDRKLFAESLQHATEQHTGAALDAALDELGWHDALEDDRRDAVSLLFELQGAANVTSSASQCGAGQALGRDQRRSGSCPAPHRAMEPSGSRSRADSSSVHGLATSESGTLRDEAAIAYGTRRRVPGRGAYRGSFDVRPLRASIPPSAWSRSRRSDPACMSRASVARPVDWAAAVAAGAVALAYELVGVSRAMLRLAREHALERVQFGRPIAGFQAIRHRLAESLRRDRSGPGVRRRGLG